MEKIAIIDENQKRQLELKNFINAQRELTCCCTCSSVLEFAQMSRATGKPHLLIINLNEDTLARLPVSLLAGIKRTQQDMEILILTDRADTSRVNNWLRAGIAGCLPRQTPPPQLKEVIVGIRQGGAYFQPAMVRKMLDSFCLQQDLAALLTAREKEIVQCLVDGMSYKLIAHRLDIALDTVRYHLRNIYKKLQVNSKSQVISKAIRSELRVLKPI